MKKARHKQTEKVMWILVGAGAAMLASELMERSMKAGWRAVMSEDPPTNPESLDTGWKEALAWTAMSAIAIGLSQTFAKRGASLGWERALGKRPPV
jgi:hypothetical protein